MRPMNPCWAVQGWTALFTGPPAKAFGRVSWFEGLSHGRSQAYPWLRPARHARDSHCGACVAGGGHGEEAQLANCYRSCFAIAEQNQIQSIAFPAISTGAYRFPLDRATEIAVTETKEFLDTNRFLDRVTFVCFSDKAYQCYLNTVQSRTA